MSKNMNAPRESRKANYRRATNSLETTAHYLNDNAVPFADAEAMLEMIITDAKLALVQLAFIRKEKGQTHVG